RRRCETVPGRNDCRSIPYSVPVCRMETQYASESYSCTKPQVITHVSEKTIKAETEVQILTNGLVEEFPMFVPIKEKASDYSAYEMNVKLLKEPQVFVV